MKELYSREVAPPQTPASMNEEENLLTRKANSVDLAVRQTETVLCSKEWQKPTQ